MNRQEATFDVQLCPDHQKNGYSHWVGLIVHKGAPLGVQGVGSALHCQSSTVSHNAALQQSLSTAQHVAADMQAPCRLLLPWCCVILSAGQISLACVALHQPRSVCSPSHVTPLWAAYTTSLAPVYGPCWLLLMPARPSADLPSHSKAFSCCQGMRRMLAGR